MERTLAELLKLWRAERPDEWTMDEFIREAEKIEKQLQNTSSNCDYVKCSQCKDYYSDMKDNINYCPHCGSELKKHFA
jgi:rubrerythrin